MSSSHLMIELIIPIALLSIGNIHVTEQLPWIVLYRGLFDAKRKLKKKKKMERETSQTGI